MIDNIGQFSALDEPTLDFIAKNEPELIPALGRINVHSSNPYCSDAVYMRHNLDRRAGKAEMIAQSISPDAVMYRVAGSYGVNDPSVTALLGFKNGRVAAFLCIDRLRDNLNANLNAGEGIQNGLEWADLMNQLAIRGGIAAEVVFSLDNWEPGKDYETSVTWYCAPWTLMRSLGWLCSRKTSELKEFIVTTIEDGDDGYFDEETTVDDWDCMIWRMS